MKPDLFSPFAAPDQSEAAPLASINTTPLVDIMLVLLIVFLITVPVALQSLPVRLPRERAVPLQPQAGMVVLALDRDGQVYWNDTPLPAAQDVTARLAEMTGAADAAPQVQVQADGDARYASVADLLAACRAAGVTRIAFVTDPS